LSTSTSSRQSSSTPLSICKIWDADYPWDIRVEKVSASLVEAGHTVHLVCRNSARRSRYEAHGRFVIHRLPVTPRILSWAHGLFNFPHPLNLVWAVAIWRVARATRADLILVRDLPLALPAAFIARTLSIPVVLDMAEHYAGMLEDRLRYTSTSMLDRVVRSPKLARVVERMALRMVDRVIVVVEESRDRLLKAGVRPDRLTIVSNTPRLEQWGAATTSRRTKQEDALCLIYLGRLDGSRGIDVIIRGIHAAAQRGWWVQFRVIGDGPSLEPLRKLAADLSVTDRVYIEGRLPYERVRALMTDADVGVIPHYATEAWNSTIPNKLFDYMLSGLSVLVSDARPTARIVETEACGLVFRDRNVSDVVRCLSTLRDPVARTRMASRGRLAVQERLNWAIDGRRFVDATEATVSCLDTSTSARRSLT